MCQLGSSEIFHFLLPYAISTNGATSYVFTYSGDNNGLIGFFNAIKLVMETGFAVTAFLSLILNLILPEEEEDEETPELTANEADDAADAEEWNRLHGKPQHMNEVADAQSEAKA